MKLQRKVALIIIGAWLGICLIMYADSKWLIAANYQMLERSMAEMEIRDVSRAYDHSLSSLQMYSTAWAVWDEAYRFMENKSSEFIAANFVPGTFTTSRINFFMFYNNTGDLYYGQFYDLNKNEMSAVPSATLDYLEDNKNFVKHETIESKKVGILNTKDGLILMSSLPVLTGDNKGPVHGSLLMGYYLNEAYFKNLGDTVGLHLNFLSLIAIKNDVSLNTIYNRLLANPNDNLSIVNDDVASGYIVLKDIANNPLGMIQIDIPRVIYQQGLSTTYHYLLIVITLGIFVIWLTWLLIKKLVLNRVLSISNQVQKISRENKFDKQIHFHGNDELASMVLSINSMMQIINNSQTQLTYLATHDSLTDLPNRELFYDLLTQAIYKASRNNYKVAVLYLDMDTFKHVNDHYGHHVGDRLLQLIAKRIKHVIKKNCTAARQSGDEFIIFMENVTDLDQVCKLAEDILTIGIKPFSINEHEIRATFSIGISIFPDDGTTIEDLLRHADEAMYAAKKVMGNAYKVYEVKVTEEC